MGSSTERGRMKSGRLRLVLIMLFLDFAGALAFVMGFMELVTWTAAIPVVAVAWASSGYTVWRIVLESRADLAQTRE